MDRVVGTHRPVVGVRGHPCLAAADMKGKVRVAGVDPRLSLSLCCPVVAADQEASLSLGPRRLSERGPVPARVAREGGVVDTTAGWIHRPHYEVVVAG